MHGADMQLQITPARSNVIAGRIGTVEAQENESFFHHGLRFKEYT
jgi:hypothetical protein